MMDEQQVRQRRSHKRNAQERKEKKKDEDEEEETNSNKSNQVKGKGIEKEEEVGRIDEKKLSRAAEAFLKGARYVLRHQVKMSFLLFLLGILWVFLFPLVCITTGELKCRGTYFSENALMAGQAKPKFSGATLQFAASIEQSLTSWQSLPEMMTKVGLQDINEEVEGVIHGIVDPETGADRRESIILVAPSGKTHGECCSGISLILALADILSEQPWLSKKVIVVIAKDQLAFRSWVQRYHSQGWYNFSRGGIILGGLIIDIDASAVQSGISAYNVLTPGTNGLLPNLDLVNVVVELFGRFPVHTSKGEGSTDTLYELRRQGQILSSQYIDKKIMNQHQLYWPRMERLLRFMQDVAFGPTGLHAELLPFDAHALTIGASSHGPKVIPKQQGLLKLGQVVELVVRSISNLEEKFHQSYFLYLLPDTKLFVSIGEYNGSLLLVLAPLFIQFFAPFLTSQNQDGVLIGLVLNGLAFVSGLIVFGCLVHLNVSLASVMYLSFVLVLSQVYRLASSFAHHAAFTQSFRCLFIIIAHGMLGMVNYPLALISAISTTPSYVIAGPHHGVVSKLTACLALLLITPPLLMYGITLLNPEAGLWQQKELRTLFSSVDSVVTMYKNYNALHLAFVCLVHIPMHTLAVCETFMS